MDPADAQSATFHLQVAACTLTSGAPAAALGGKRTLRCAI